MYPPGVATKKSAKTAVPSLQVPSHVTATWAQIKNKIALQLFHGDPEKRLAAVAALLDKFNYYDRRGALLLAAAIDDPDPRVCAAMLRGVAQTGRYLAWTEILRLRSHGERFSQNPDPAVRAALALLLAATLAPPEPDDVPWLAALLDDPSAQDERVFDAVALLLARLASTGAPGACDAFARAARLPTVGPRALWRFHIIGDARRALVPLLIELSAGDSIAATSAALLLARIEPLDDPARAIAAIESLRDRRPDGWELDLTIGLIDRSSLPARIAKHAAHLTDASITKPGFGTIVEALSFAPEAAQPFVPALARSVLETIAHTPLATRARWVRGNAALVAAAIEPHLFEVHSSVYILPWWDQLRPATAAADALCGIEKILASHPRGTLTYQEQRFCEECCGVLRRMRASSPAALALLARLGARQVPHLVSSVIPTVRAMHALGATDADLAPIVAVYEAEAQASDRRELAANPAFDTSSGWGAKLRQTATALSALGSIASVRARWSAFDFLATSSFHLDGEHVLAMLQPFLDEPDVRDLFERALSSPWASVQRASAGYLGLLVDPEAFSLVRVARSSGASRLGITSRRRCARSTRGTWPSRWWTTAAHAPGSAATSLSP